MHKKVGGINTCAQLSTHYCTRKLTETFKYQLQFLQANNRGISTKDREDGCNSSDLLVVQLPGQTASFVVSARAESVASLGWLEPAQLWAFGEELLRSQ